MDRKKARQEDGKKVFGIRKPKVKLRHQDPDYNLDLYPGDRLTETGLLEIGQLTPMNSSLPTFIFRWDQKDDLFDVEIHNVSADVKKMFCAGTDGYFGHHPQRVANYDIKVHITIPGREIFDADIDIGVLKKFRQSLALYSQFSIEKIEMGKEIEQKATMQSRWSYQITNKNPAT